MNAGDPKVVVKKVKAYPIDADFVHSGQAAPIKGKIVRLTTGGMQALFERSVFGVGDVVRFSFEFPVMKNRVEETAKVVKAYIQFRDDTKTKKDHLIEFHFKDLTSEGLSAITAYLVKIGQWS